MKKFRFLSISLLLLIGCSSKHPDTRQTPAPLLDMDAIAAKLVLQSKLQPGERVLLIGLPGQFDSLVIKLKDKIVAAGATYLGAISVDTVAGPPGWKTDFTRTAEGKSREELAKLFDQVDLGIMLPGANPTHLSYAALQDVLKRGKGRTIHFHWIGSYDFSSAPIPVDTPISRFYQRALLETDYQHLSTMQENFEAALRKHGATITTPEGTNLSFQIGDRAVTRQNGDASLEHTKAARTLIDREIELPAGAIRVAPIEESVQGTIAFPDAQWNGGIPVQNLVVTIKNGKIIRVDTRMGAKAVRNELERAGDAGYSFREVAIGFNPLLAIPADRPWIPYYGYGAGVVRLSLGDNTELGGNVKGNYVRWNFFTDATVTVGGEVWIKDGKLVKE